MPKTILITGTSSGFGRDTAETLHRAGQTVYASMRGAQGKNHRAAEALRKLAAFLAFPTHMPLALTLV